MNQDTILFAVRSAIKDLYTDDNELLIEKYDVNERSVTNRLALHLQKHYTNYRVDAEYNRMRKNYNNLNKKALKKKIGWHNWGVTDKSVSVYPDVIVHRRNTPDNFIVIEVKMSWKRDKRIYDLMKINQYITELNYQHGLYVELSENKYSIGFGKFEETTELTFPTFPTYLYTDLL